MVNQRQMSGGWVGPPATPQMPHELELAHVTTSSTPIRKVRIWRREFVVDCDGREAYSLSIVDQHNLAYMHNFDSDNAGHLQSGLIVTPTTPTVEDSIPLDALFTGSVVGAVELPFALFHYQRVWASGFNDETSEYAFRMSGIGQLPGIVSQTADFSKAAPSENVSNRSDNWMWQLPALESYLHTRQAKWWKFSDQTEVGGEHYQRELSRISEIKTLTTTSNLRTIPQPPPSTRGHWIRITEFRTKLIRHFMLTILIKTFSAQIFYRVFNYW